MLYEGVGIMKSPSEEILKRSKDEPYAQLLGMTTLEVSPGHALVEMKYEPSMKSLLGAMHGGAIFSLIDDAFEFGANSHGTLAVALNMNITFMAMPKAGSTLRAECREINVTNRTGTYEIMVTDDSGTKIALCQALAYRKKDPLSFLEKS